MRAQGSCEILKFRIGIGNALVIPENIDF